ncbi:MAG: glutamyl-tRNA reductase [Gemmataceae bacterium]
MNLLLLGASFKNTPIELREKLAFDGPRLPAALQEINSRYGCEAVILSTCNRVELYLARPQADPLDADLLFEFLAEFHRLAPDLLKSHLYLKRDRDAIHHLFRVVSSLDSLIVGEGQIAGQVKKAYEEAQRQATAGPVLHPLFQIALQVAKRVRTETGIARGHVSVSSVAVDYVKEVFDHFGDKTILVIGAGKMGELTLKHLEALRPHRILVTNRSPDKAQAVAAGCGGHPVPWDQLDDALVQADIVLSTTGAPEPIMTRRRFNAILARRPGGTVVILDIAVPRDFDPAIHDGDRACLFNIDDLQRIREQTLADRKKHVPPAESIVDQEVKRFLKDSKRRSHGPIIAKLTQDFESRRKEIVTQLMNKLNGRLSEEDRAYIEGAFRLLQNQFLHGPISALAEEAPEPGRHTLLEALRKLFRLEE